MRRKVNAVWPWPAGSSIHRIRLRRECWRIDSGTIILGAALSGRRATSASTESADPSELLDWLARQVHAHGWKLKPSPADRHLDDLSPGSAQPAMAAIDADAHYLWRFPPRRLEAESVRDALLAVSGKLDATMGGPGFRLYQYTVDNVAAYTPLDKVGPETYRRTVYHQNPRSVRVDLLGQLDCPDCSLPAPSREVTVTPLQALALQNHSFMLDMAQAFAERLAARSRRRTDRVRSSVPSACFRPRAGFGGGARGGYAG